MSRRRRRVGGPGGTLQLVGERDPVAPRDGARWLNEQLVNATIVERPSFARTPMLEASGAFEAGLLRFLST